jgi:DNA-binding response OmpR family regulator
VRILAVDDGLHRVPALRRGLEAEGYDVDMAPDGVEMQWMAAETPYDAIVLDMALPGMSGDVICGQLRTLGNWTPVLMLTAMRGKTEPARALDCGADGFLAKPFSYEVLGARLRSLIRPSVAARTSVLVAGDLRLESATHAVHRGKIRIDLTPKQSSLLEHLLRRAGEVVSKPSILKHLGDFDVRVDPSIVDVYVRQLRMRIDEPFGRRSIETVRLVGYRLDPGGG